MKTATVKLYYDTRRGHNTIKLLVTFMRKQRLYSTGLKVDSATWSRLEKNADREAPDGKIKDEDFLNIWTSLWNRPEKYNDSKRKGTIVISREIVDKLGPNFTFEGFKDQLDNYGKDKAPKDFSNVLSALERKAEYMKGQGRFGNGNNYGLVAKSLKRFIDSLTIEERKEYGLPPILKRTASQTANSAQLEFKHISREFLAHYEEWMLTYGKAPKSKGKPASGASLTTVGIYCRHLRAAFNDAIADNIISQEQYPFGKKGYTIPSQSNNKRALTLDEIRKLLSYECISNMEQRGRDLWFFSYFGNGMNMADICSLRWKDIDYSNNTLSFIRQKTSRSRKSHQIKVKVHLNDETLAILERWGTKPPNPNSFVFPFLNEEMNAERRRKSVQQVTKMTNKYIRLIAISLGIKGDVTTYAARHSFATILVQSDNPAPLAFISQALGHSTTKTTEAYLGSFDDERTKGYLKGLL